MRCAGHSSLLPAISATGLVLASLDRDTAAHLAIPRAARFRPASSACLRACAQRHVFRTRACWPGSALELLSPRLRFVVPMLVFTELFVGGRMGVDQQIGARWDGMDAGAGLRVRVRSDSCSAVSPDTSGAVPLSGLCTARGRPIVPYTQSAADQAHGKHFWSTIARSRSDSRTCKATTQCTWRASTRTCAS